MRRLMVMTVGLASAAHAAGFYFGDNGSKALIQGGAFTAQADDISAMQHNPAGLTQLRGLSFLVDGNFLNNEVTFWRQETGWNPAAPSNLMEKVTRTGSNFISGGSVFLSPMFGAAYGFSLFGRQATVALGAFAPPSVGRNDYPAPDYSYDPESLPGNPKYVRNPKRYAPNRYMLVKRDIVIMFPTLSLAYDIHPKVQAGVSLQLVTSKFDFSQSLYSGFNTPMRSVEEDPTFDTLVTANLPGRLGFTGIAGVMVRPTDSLSFGASVRPPIPIKAHGKLTFALGEQAQRVNSVVTGDEAELTFTMPLELRVGARFSPSRTWGVNADFVYQGWNSLDGLYLTPIGVTLKNDLSADPTVIAPFKIPKNWVATFSGRVGGSVRPIKWVSASAGFWFETSAQPTTYIALDFPHPTRVFLTGGLTGHLGPIDVIAGIAYTPTVTLNVTDSEQRQGQTNSTVKGSVIGNGQYVAGGFIATVGVRGNFQFGESKAAESKPTPVIPPESGQPASAPK